MHHNPVWVQNLSYCYPDGTPALRGIDLLIQPAERVALIGANGSGKSTLQLHLNGVLLPQTGSVQVGSWTVVPENLRAVREFVGLVFQNPEHQLFMPTVWEDVAFGVLNQGVLEPELGDRVAQALKAMNLDPTVYGPRLTDHLSGGEQKRVAIAGVLAMNPQVLVLDEPSAQLDPRSRRLLIQLLDRLPLTQLIATHDLDLALDLCPRTVVLNQGCIVYDGATEEVLADADFLHKHSLELPLSYSRSHCFLDAAPKNALQG